jgi:hypothetical protein
MDGREIGRKKKSGGIDSSSQSLLIGNGQYGNEGFIGTIDEVKIWSLEGANKTLVTHYSFEEEGNSTKIKDESGNGLDGILVGAKRTSEGYSGNALVFGG